MNIRVKFLCGHVFSILLGVNLGVERLALMITLFNILRYYQTVPQSGCPILHSHSNGNEGGGGEGLPRAVAGLSQGQGQFIVTGGGM